MAKIREQLFVPPGRNLALTPPEQQQAFKNWLKESGIPFSTRRSAGREYVLWDEQYTASVRQWAGWEYAPEQALEQPESAGLLHE